MGRNIGYSNKMLIFLCIIGIVKPSSTKLYRLKYQQASKLSLQGSCSPHLKRSEGTDSSYLEIVGFVSY